MFSLTFWLLVLNLRRLDWLAVKHQTTCWLVLQGIGLCLVHAMYRAHLKFQVLVLLAILCVLGTEYLVRRRFPGERVPLRPLSIALGLLLCAQLASLADVLRVACDPQHAWLHGHVIWHHLSGIALYFAAQYYRAISYPLPPSVSSAR